MISLHQHQVHHHRQGRRSPGCSSISIGSTSPEDRRADVVFDKIEDLLCEFMRDPVQQRLHCRVLRWSLEEDPLKVFTGVVFVNPPTINR